MSRRQRIVARMRARPVWTTFLCLVSIPLVLALFSFRQPIPLPGAVLSEFELLFRLFVYVPVGAVRAVLFDPLGLGVLFSVPGIEQVTIAATLCAFYYLVSHVLVRLATYLGDQLPATAR